MYVLVIIRLDRRDLIWIKRHSKSHGRMGCTFTEAFPWDEAPRHLIRDRDRIYGSVVTRRLRAMGIRDRPTAPASPWQNGFAERLIGSIRRECVDHIIVLRETHLRRVLRAILPFLAVSSTIVLGVVQPPPPPMPPGRVFVAREQ
ncbi:MAG: hypothetical protein QOJ17_2285 [Rhodospirillaceae bacterium]|nr:hypothetical protein [Rhodospirillaceae bacterium]